MYSQAPPPATARPDEALSTDSDRAEPSLHVSQIDPAFGNFSGRPLFGLRGSLDSHAVPNNQHTRVTFGKGEKAVLTRKLNFVRSPSKKIACSCSWSTI